MWGALLVFDLLFRAELREFVVRWQVWVSLMVTVVLFQLELRLVAYR